MRKVLNYRMLCIFFENIYQKQSLKKPLSKILSEGFICQHQCYLLRSLYKNQSHINQSSFQDKTGYECFINSIHIDDYIKTDLFSQSILFAKEIIDLWHSSENGLVLTISIAETESGFNIKFHAQREKEEWINEDEIYNFEQGMLIIHSS